MLSFIRRRLRSPGDARGFTMVELMIALAIMGVGILSVGRLFIFAQHHASYGREEKTTSSVPFKLSDLEKIE